MRVIQLDDHHLSEGIRLEPGVPLILDAASCRGATSRLLVDLLAHSDHLVVARPSDEFADAINAVGLTEAIHLAPDLHSARRLLESMITESRQRIRESRDLAAIAREQAILGREQMNRYFSRPTANPPPEAGE